MLRGLRFIQHPLDVLLLAGPIAFVADVLHWHAAVLFFASGLAIMPLARLIGVATEELAGRLGSGVGGLLNATFGNATELIIAIVALLDGQYELVKASLVGSILGNVLVVLGLSFLLGGLDRERQRFDRTGAGAASAQLLLTASSLLVPTVLVSTSTVSATSMEGLSVATALILLVAYVAGLTFTLRTHAHLYTEDDEEAMHGPGWGIRNAVIVLLVATVAVAVLSEWLVTGVKGVTGGLGWTETFVGVILVALIGNAAEHASAVTAARRDHMNLSLAIALGSATQIALFVAPALVLLGLAVGRPLNLLFDTFEVVSVVIAAILTNALLQDGESTWLEGVQLLAVYAVLAAAFFLHP